MSARIKTAVKHSVAGLMVASGLVCSLSACNEENFSLREAEGFLSLNTIVKSEMSQSRSEISQELQDKCLIWISNPKGLVREYKGLNQLPTGKIPLIEDHYVVEGWTGDSVSASFDHRWYKGREEFDITAYQPTNVDLVCRIANVAAKVNYFDDIDAVLKDYKFTIGHKKGSLDFIGKETRRGYFMMPSSDKNLSWSFTATDFSGELVEESGVIENVKPGTEYTLNINLTPQSSDTGGTYFYITVDAREITIVDEVIISIAPIIEGDGFDINEPIENAPGSITGKTINITADKEMPAINISMPGLGNILGLGQTDAVGLLTASEETVSKIIEGGISWAYNPSVDNDGSVAVIHFSEDFFNKLTQEGTYPISISATDTENRTTTKQLVIILSNRPVKLDDIDPVNIWGTTASLSGKINKASTNISVEYSPAASRQDWIKAETTVSGNVFTATLNSLIPGTTYQARVICDGYIPSEDDYIVFTTEPDIQLENAGFEDWNTSSTPYLLYAAGKAQYWDSGNHGSAKAGVNLTTPCSDVKHSGNYSAQLKSAFASVMGIGKFAAGNCFYGKYLATAGTDGILGWGRPFSSRPKNLTVYVKYRPQTVNRTSADVPELASGQTDIGIIYVALLDDTHATYTDGSKTYPSGDEVFPVIVATKSSNRQLFNKEAANVIAYGEYQFTEDTQGEDMIKVTIPINYYKTGIIPSYIMVVCSASKYGDYFAGADNSTMWVDDMKLEY